MSEFRITLDRTFIRDDDEVKEIWAAEVENAEAYDRVGAETAAGALRLLADEFDEKFREGDASRTTLEESGIPDSVRGEE